jgi:hypothetical protein
MTAPLNTEKNKVSIDEYIDALKVVELYHAQLASLISNKPQSPYRNILNMVSGDEVECISVNTQAKHITLGKKYRVFDVTHGKDYRGKDEVYFSIKMDNGKNKFFSTSRMNSSKTEFALI